MEALLAGAAAQSIFSAVINPIVEKAYKMIAGKKQKQPETSLDKEIEALADQLKLQVGWLLDAEEKKSKDARVSKWLDKLEDLMYDVEDLLDDYAADGNKQKHENKPVSPLLCCFPVVNNPFKGYATRLKDVTENLYKITEERKELGLQYTSETAASVPVTPSFQRPQTLSFIDDESSIFGRSELKNSIVEQLLGWDGRVESSNTKRCSYMVLPLVGMGGIGKTTLAKLVFNDRKAQTHFDYKIWVCVSFDFNVDRLRGEIMEMVLDPTHKKENHRTLNLSALHMKFKEQLEGKRYILVLDDVWNEDRRTWDELLEPLNVGSVGSVIIATTRSFKVVDAISSHMETVTLEGLSGDDIWKVFKHHAFKNWDLSDSTRYSHHEMVGKQMMTKLKGSPLAARSLGGLLNTFFDIKQWRNISRNKIWENIEKDIKPILQLSYQHLHPTSRRCFQYCSLFPQDFEFEMEDIVDLWIVEGFIQPQNGMEIHDVGIKYFDDLKKRSFFQLLRTSPEIYVMHDLIHDLAQDVSSRVYSWKLDSEPKAGYKRTRHISCSRDDLDVTRLKSISEFHKLRTLIGPSYFYVKGGAVIQNVLNGWFTRLVYMRVLKLPECNIRKIPDSIGNLKHLRYLDVSHSMIEQVPTSIGSCRKLEVLNLEFCIRLIELPNNICELVHMQYLKVDNHLIHSLNGIGKLTALVRLEEFNVSTKKGRKIEELKHLNLLRGTLWIGGLENVENKEEAANADLHKKERLDKIELHWRSDEATHKSDEEGVVLESLVPHEYLRELVIKGNHGSKPPTWLSKEYMQLLETIILRECTQWESLPPLGSFVSLRSMKLEGLKSLKRLDGQFNGCDKVVSFPCLEEVALKGNINLEEWETSCKGRYSCFPRLGKLEIVDCPKLKKIPYLPSTLEKLWISCCPELSLDLEHVIDTRKQGSIGFLSSLKLLDIHKSPRIIPSSFLLQRVVQSSLESLAISCFDGHDESLTMSCLSSLTKLKELRLRSCPNIPYVVVDADVGAYLESQSAAISASPCTTDMTLEEVSAPQPPRCLASVKKLCISRSPKFLPCLAQYIGTRGDDGTDKREQDVPAMALDVLLIQDEPLHPLLQQNHSTLEELTISSCGDITSFPVHQQNNFSKLRNLSIHDCRQLASIALEEFPMLRELVISSCPVLFVAPPVTRSSLTLKLEILIIENCNVQLIVQLLQGCRVKYLFLKSIAGLTCFDGELEEAFLGQQSLDGLRVDECDDLLCLPKEIGRLSSLSWLKLRNCPKMQHLPEDLPQLPEMSLLNVSGCPELRKRYSREEGGPGWETVSHIHNVFIR